MIEPAPPGVDPPTMIESEPSIAPASPPATGASKPVGSPEHSQHRARFDRGGHRSDPSHAASEIQPKLAALLWPGTYSRPIQPS